MNVAAALWEGGGFERSVTVEVADVWEQDNNGVGWTTSEDDIEFAEEVDRFRTSAHAGTDLGMYDVTMLMTGLDIGFTERGEFLNDTTGIANAASLCTKEKSTMLVEDRDSVGFAGETVAHELGHLFSAHHDGYEEYDTGDCDPQAYIMAAATTGEPVEDWSLCSVRAVDKFIEDGNACCLEEGAHHACGDGIEEENDDGSGTQRVHLLFLQLVAASGASVALLR